MLSVIFPLSAAVVGALEEPELEPELALPPAGAFVQPIMVTARRPAKTLDTKRFLFIPFSSPLQK
jgi:hypothetical protein